MTRFFLVVADDSRCFIVRAAYSSCVVVVTEEEQEEAQRLQEVEAMETEKVGLWHIFAKDLSCGCVLSKMISDDDVVITLLYCNVLCESSGFECKQT